MAEGMKVRAKVKDGVTTVKALIYHVMESGSRKDKETGELIPAHFIKEIKADKIGFRNTPFFEESLCGKASQVFQTLQRCRLM